MWSKGWKVTGVWMAGYAFLCVRLLQKRFHSLLIKLINELIGYFPRLLLLLPHTILLAIILSTHLSTSPPTTKSQPAAASTQAPPPPENLIAWQANMQGIQNLMGTLSDLDDFIHLYIPYITPIHIYTHTPHTRY